MNIKRMQFLYISILPCVLFLEILNTISLHATVAELEEERPIKRSFAEISQLYRNRVYQARRIGPIRSTPLYDERQRRRNIVAPIFLPVLMPEMERAETDAHEDLITGSQIDGILKIYKSSAEVVLDPTRPGDDFSEQEKGLAIAITQIVPNNETCCLKALALVFSSERAKKILESIVEG